MPGLILIPMILGSAILLFVLFFGIKARTFPKPVPMAPLTDAYWLEVESQADAAIPSALRKLYADEVLINSMDLSFVDPATGKAWPVEYILWPQEEPCLIEIESVGQIFCFGDTGEGDRYFIKLPRRSETSPVASTDVAPVFRRDHETGEILSVAPSLTDFLSWQQSGEVLDTDIQTS